MIQAILFSIALTLYSFLFINNYIVLIIIFILSMFSYYFIFYKKLRIYQTKLCNLQECFKFISTIEIKSTLNNKENCLSAENIIDNYKSIQVFDLFLELINKNNSFDELKSKYSLMMIEVTRANDELNNIIRENKNKAIRYIIVFLINILIFLSCNIVISNVYKVIKSIPEFEFVSILNIIISNLILYIIYDERLKSIEEFYL